MCYLDFQLRKNVLIFNIQVSDSTIIESMFDRALEKANDESSDEFTKEAVMDILRYTNIFFI